LGPDLLSLRPALKCLCRYADRDTSRPSPWRPRGRSPSCSLPRARLGACFNTATICSTLKRFCFTANPPLCRFRFCRKLTLGVDQKSRGPLSLDPKHISTCHVERQNLTMRMSMRRFTRLTNAFSKKVDNHLWAIAPHYRHYIFCRIHKSLRVTPAMEAGITDHVWSIEEIAELLESK
jgi:hypothetical protein